MQNTLEQAKQYLKNGWSVIPVVKESKKPLIHWTEYQTRKPTEKELGLWFKDTENNIALVCGKISGILVIDIDKGFDLTSINLPPTLIVKTGQGYHYYYKYPKDTEIGCITKFNGKNLDIKGNGSLCTMPPSIHPNGKQYSWDIANPSYSLKIAECPKWVIDTVQVQRGAKADWAEIMKGVPKGKRNETSATITGKVLYGLKIEDWMSVGWPLIAAWNEKNSPPLPIQELRETFRSVAELENKRREGKSINIISTNKWNIIPGDRLEKIDIPESEFLIDKLVPLSGITILSGKPSAFKSWLLLLISFQVSRGIPLFNQFNTKPAKTLYIDEETSLSEIKRRWMMIKDNIATPVYFSSMAGFKIDNKQQRDILLEICKKDKYKLLIIDSLRDVHTKNENDSGDAQMIIDGFKKFTTKNIHILISHHQRKESFMNSKDPSQMLRGSDAFLAGVDSLLTIENPKSTKESAELIITQSKLRQGRKTEPFKINVFEKEGKMMFEYGGELETNESKIEKAKITIKGLLKQEGEMFQSQIIEYLVPLNYSPHTLRRAIKELKESNEIKPRLDGKKLYFSLNTQMGT